MQARKSFVLDVSQNAPLEYIYAKQGDIKSRFLEITLINSGQSVEIPEGATARLQLKKTDGTTVINDGMIENGKIVVELTEQALALPGIAFGEIAVYDGATLLTSQVFYLKIDESAVLGTTATSSDEFLALIDAMLRVEQAGLIADKALTAAETALESISDFEIEVGTVTTGEPDTSASVTNSGTKQNAVLDFVIPRGYTGIGGTTPHIGDNGNWYIGDVDTGFKAVGRDGNDGKDGDTGATGPSGAVFTPSVSAAGVISWSNNGGLSNPSSVNIKGDTGNTGAKGTKGDTGQSITLVTLTQAEFDALPTKDPYTLYAAY